MWFASHGDIKLMISAFNKDLHVIFTVLVNNQLDFLLLKETHCIYYLRRVGQGISLDESPAEAVPEKFVAAKYSSGKVCNTMFSI